MVRREQRRLRPVPQIEHERVLARGKFDGL